MKVDEEMLSLFGEFCLNYFNVLYSKYNIEYLVNFTVFILLKETGH